MSNHKPRRSAPRGAAKSTASHKAASSARPERDLTALILALTGAVLAAVLWATGDSGGLPGCAAEGGCASVQQSPWASLFGIPIAAWGVAGYGTLAVLALRPRPLPRALSPLIASVALAVSVWLNLASWHALHAVCPWCLLSLLIMGALCLRTWMTSPKTLRRWLAGLSGVLAVLAVLVMARLQSGPALAPAEAEYRAGLAKHLTAIGARFYGAQWCGACAGQKALFGAAADALPYVECSPHGAGTPQATDCLAAEIRSYPTWIIRNDKRQGALGLAQLARLSGYAAPPEGRGE